jgi:hypothetical protein
MLVGKHQTLFFSLFVVKEKKKGRCEEKYGKGERRMKTKEKKGD